MERYNRAFRDPKSPLTPLMPLEKNVFDFDNCSPNSGHHTPKAVTKGRIQNSVQKLLLSSKEQSHLRNYTLQVPKRFSKDFLRVREVFEKKEPLGIHECGDSIPTEMSSFSVEQLKYKQASPIVTRELSPRMSNVLNKMGLGRHVTLFSRQEIDTEVFCMMTISDIQSLGITNPQELHKILGAIRYSRQMFK